MNEIVLYRYDRQWHIIFQLKCAIRNKDEVRVQNLIGHIHDSAVIKAIDEKVMYSLLQTTLSCPPLQPVLGT